MSNKPQQILIASGSNVWDLKINQLDILETYESWLGNQKYS